MDCKPQRKRRASKRKPPKRKPITKGGRRLVFLLPPSTDPKVMVAAIRRFVREQEAVE